jgi:4-amino-4-deoxy-L-arabinose transferase-like glycosyltransferase
MNLIQKRSLLALGLILLAAAVWKLLLLSLNAMPFNADEAVVGLMARHILQGDRPVFFYGQAYMGSLDAFLVAAGFSIFGAHVWVIRLVQTLLYLGTIITTVQIARTAFRSDKAGEFAGLLLAIPAVNTTLYTTVSLGGYGEALLIGSLALLIAVTLYDRRVHGSDSIEFVKVQGLYLVLGLLSGLGLWANAISLVLLVPAGLLALYCLASPSEGQFRGPLWQPLAFMLAGFLIGSFPWWIYALQYGVRDLLSELTGSAVAVENTAWIQMVSDHLVRLLLLGSTALFGLRPPWEVRWLAVPLLPFALAGWLGVLTLFFRKSTRPNPHQAVYLTLAGVICMLSAGFVFTSFGIDPSGRYFVPLVVPLALVAGHGLDLLTRDWRLQAVILGLVLVFHAWGTLDSAFRNPPGITTQFDLATAVDHSYDDELIRFLQEQGETTGYTNYWIAYPLAFKSNESLIFVPRLPYHHDFRYTSRDDRYEPYQLVVSQAEQAAYITPDEAWLDDAIRAGFEQHGIEWQEQRIGGYRVFYELSQPVSPESLKLGELTPSS